MRDTDLHLDQIALRQPHFFCAESDDVFCAWKTHLGELAEDKKTVVLSDAGGQALYERYRASANALGDLDRGRFEMIGQRTGLPDFDIIEMLGQGVRIALYGLGVCVLIVKCRHLAKYCW